MKITRSKLKEIIREVLNEGDVIKGPWADSIDPTSVSPEEAVIHAIRNWKKKRDYTSEEAVFEFIKRYGKKNKLKWSDEKAEEIMNAYYDKYWMDDLDGGGGLW